MFTIERANPSIGEEDLDSKQSMHTRSIRTSPLTIGVSLSTTSRN